MNTLFDTENSFSPEGEKPFEFGNVLKSIRKRVWWIAAIFIPIVAMTTIWNFMATPLYQATVKILIDPKGPNVVKLEEVLERDLKPSEFYKNQIYLLTSNSLAERVVKNLKLSAREGFGKPQIEKEYFFSALLKFLPSLPEKNGEIRAINALKARLAPQFIKGGSILLLRFVSPDPILAAEIANSIAENYINLTIGMRIDASNESYSWLTQEIKKVRKELLESEQVLQKYRERFNLLSLKERQNIISQNLKEMSTSYTRAKSETTGLRILVQKIKSINGDASGLEILPGMFNNHILQELKNALAMLEREKSEMSLRYGPDHPKFIRMNAKIRSTKKKIKLKIREIADSIIVRFQVAEANEMSFGESLQKQKKEALRLDGLAIQYRTLEREAETNRKVFETLLARARETRIFEGLKSTGIRILDRAEIPSRPFRPQKIKNILISMGAALFLGLLLIYALESMDDRFRSPKDVDSLTGIPVLGVIPELGKKIGKHDPLLRLKGKRQSAGLEQFKNVETVLFYQYMEKYKIIQFSSCIPGEGKSFILANIATRMALRNKKVLILDGDLRKPTANKIFGIPPTKGLAHYLLGKAKLDEIIYRVPNSSLNMIPAGETNAEISNLLIQSDLINLLESLRDEFDTILIDSPPFLSLNDALVWSKSVDGLIYVVDLQQVTPSMVLQVADNLRKLDVEILGSIVNRLQKYAPYYCYGCDRRSNHYYES